MKLNGKSQLMCWMDGDRVDRPAVQNPFFAYSQFVATLHHPHPCFPWATIIEWLMLPAGSDPWQAWEDARSHNHERRSHRD